MSSEIFQLRIPVMLCLILKIQAGDSWTLGRVGHLLSSREDSVKEGESLLFCLWGLT